MSQTTSTPESISTKPGFFDKLAHDVKERPKFWAAVVVIAGLVLSGALVTWQLVKRSRVEAHNERREALSKAQSTGETPEERVAQLKELASLMKDSTEEPYYLVTLARAQRAAGDQATTQQEKLGYYRDAIAAIDQLKSSYPNNVWTVMPWKPTVPGGTPAPSTADAIKQYCEAQLQWIEQHPIAAEGEPDPGLTATVVLEEPVPNADPKKHTFRIQFFSKAAPYAVDNFLKLAREGHFDGTKLHGLQKSQFGDELAAAHLGSPMSKVAPDDISAWTTPQDEIGYSLPLEPSMLKPERGAIVLEPMPEAGGVNPGSFTILLTNPANPRMESRIPFARVHPDDRAILDTLATLSTDPDHPLAKSPATLFAPAKPWKIASVTVEGQPAHPPARPLSMPYEAPEPPKKEAKEEPKEEGGDKGTEPPK